MANPSPDTSPLFLARTAGALYLVIIVCGLFGELGVRGTLIEPGDAAATARKIQASQTLFRLGFLADSVMAVCDVALAALLYTLLRPVDRTLALLALGFRLIQAAAIACNLLNYVAAGLLLGDAAVASAFDAGQQAALAAWFLDLHGHGYDLGLIFFGVHCLLLGWLIAKASFLPTLLGALSAAAGGVYLIGSYTRFLQPGAVEAVAPIYLIALVAELSLCLWLLCRGVDPDRWRAAERGRGGLEHDVSNGRTLP